MPDKQDKTEQPTPRRLEKAREEGQVPQSQEILSAATLIALTAATALLGPWFVRWCRQRLLTALELDTSVLDNSQAFMAFAHALTLDVLRVISPFMLVVMVAGVGSSMLVTGPHYSVKALAWKLDRLSWAKGIKQLFSKESLVKLGLSILKLIFISLIVWFYVKARLPMLATFQWVHIDQMLGAIGGLILGAVLRICAGLIVIAALDVIFHKWKHIEDLKMTKHEVKDERRDTDGAPEVKTQIRRKQFEAAMHRMLQDVPKADVVLVNPDHVAVALQYDPTTMQAPTVVAKGGDHMCEKIKDAARSYGVPIIRRPSLARELFATVKLGKPVPDKLFVAVAEVLALVYRLRKNK